MQPGELPLRAFLAPIADDLAHPTTTEVVINKPGEVGVEQNGKWTWRDVPEFTFERLDQIGILAGYATGRDLDSETPLCGTTLPDGQRIQICRPAATRAGTIAMCIRKPPKTARRLDDPDMLDLFAAANAGARRRSAISETLLALYNAGDWPAFLVEAVKTRRSIGTVGLTGSGKSDVLRRLLGAVPDGHRLITVESDPEFGDVGPRNKVALFYDENSERRRAVDVVQAALRMFPSTIAFQEVRGSEAFALMRAILSGHNSFTSWHGSEGGEIDALCMMLRQHKSCETVPQEQLTILVKQCFDIIAYCERRDGVYQVTRVWFRDAEQAA